MRRRSSEDDDDRVLRDGETGRCHLLFRDGKTVKVTDSSGGTTGLHRPGFRVAALDAVDERNDAYAEYERCLTTAWQRDAAPPGSYPLNAAAEGTSCTINGAPGTLVREGNYLICKPTGSRSDSVPLTDARAAAYKNYDEEISRQWRNA